jgi:hypothetical protein
LLPGAVTRDIPTFHMATSNAQNPPHRHHYLPQFFLKEWTGDDGRLERFTKPYRNKLDIKRRPTKAVGWWDDLYIAPEGDPHKSHFLEWGFFKQLDDGAARVLRKLNATPIPALSVEEISSWSTFLMSLLHRTPENLAAYKETAGRIYDEVVPELRDRYDELRTPGDPETVEEYEASLTPEDRERAVMRNFAHVIANPNIGRFLNQLHWSAIDRPDDCPDYLLSDDPLARMNGLKKPDGHLAIPVSPRRLAVGVYDKNFLEELRRLRPRDLVRRMNTWTVEGARHFVVSTDLRQTRFIDNRFGANPKRGFART